MQPNKVNGKTIEQRERMCGGKRRWSDQLSAVAGGLSSLEYKPSSVPLYTYQCPICRGYHLTRTPHPDQEPIKVEDGHAD